MKKKVSFKSFPLLKGIKNEKEVDRFIDRSISVYQELLPTPTRKFIEHVNSSECRETLKDLFSRNLEIDYHTESYEKAVIDSGPCILETILKNIKKQEKVESRFTKFFNLLSKKNIENEEDDIEILRSAIDLLGNRRREGILIGKHEIDGKQLRDYFIYQLDLYEGEPVISVIRIDEVGSDQRGKSDEVIDYVFDSSKVFYNKKSKKFKVLGLYHISNESYGSQMANDIAWILLLLIFKEIAETEVEYIDVVDTNKIPKNISKFQRQNYINGLEGDITINYYTANWYTEIVRNEEFGVRGHWRNQPYKNGYKLIFIKPFKKHGYHRKAEKDQVTFKKEGK